MLLEIPYGFPGSGKGTQTKNILADPDFNIVDHIILGDIFRQMAIEEPEGLVAMLMKAGDLIPDEIVFPMIWNFFKKNRTRYRPEGSFLIDGFPRDIDQAKEILYIQKAVRLSAVVVYHMVVPGEVCQQRLIKRAEEAARGNGKARVDDRKLEVIDKRIADHGASARHVLPFLKEQNNVFVHDIDGNVAPRLVAEQIKICSSLHRGSTKTSV